MLYSLTFTINVLPITLNKALRGSWKKWHGNFDVIQKIIHLKTIKTRPKVPIQKAHITLTRYSAGTLDRDNMFFTFKPVIDGLVNAGVIIDDGFNQVKELTPIQIKSKRKEARIEVHVQELE
jgi:Holliday junction resolvase RusA-like endonuclease